MATTVHDDYLVCGEYQEQINSHSADYPGFITFQHANGNHYFAWVNGNEIVMRSEAYPDADKMERGIKAVIKNSELPERYSVIEEHGAHFLLLWGGGDHQAHTGNLAEHNEVGRSCPHKSREELNALLQFKGADFANKVVPISGGSADAGVAAAATAVTATAATASSGVEATVDAGKAVVSEALGAVSGGADAGKAAVGAAVAGATALAGKAMASGSETTSTVGGHVQDAYNEASGGGMGWLKWLLPLLLLGGAFFWWKSCDKDKNGGTAASTSTEASTNAAATTTTAALPKITVDSTTGVVNYDLGATSDLELPGGVKLTGIAKDGFENTLVNFIKTGKVDTANKKANWFNLHDVQFVSGKTLYATPKAMMQIKNVAATLKAYPNVVIKLGGYTDISGKAADNLSLSDRRAKQVMKDLIANGAAANQIKEAVGYGSEFAEAKLGDKEGMARDRKTAAKVASM